MTKEQIIKEFEEKTGLRAIEVNGLWIYTYKSKEIDSLTYYANRERWLISKLLEAEKENNELKLSLSREIAKK